MAAGIWNLSASAVEAYRKLFESRALRGFFHEMALHSSRLFLAGINQAIVDHADAKTVQIGCGVVVTRELHLLQPVFRESKLRAAITARGTARRRVHRGYRAEKGEGRIDDVPVSARHVTAIGPDRASVGRRSACCRKACAHANIVFIQPDEFSSRRGYRKIFTDNPRCVRRDRAGAKHQAQNR